MADESADMRRSAAAMEADLQRCMVMLGSVGAEEQGRLLRVGGLLGDLRDAVARVHRAVLTSHGMRYGKLYERLLTPASAGLREALERVLVLRLRPTAGSFLARLVHRRLVVGKLWRSLWEFMVIEFHLNPKHRHDEVAERVQELAVDSRTSSQFEQPMVGTSDLVKKMVKSLLAATKVDQPSSSSTPPPPSPLVVMPIVGGPGTGKTRLAQALFEDAGVCSAFGAVRAWVHVSQRYDLRRVLWGILASLLEQVRQGEEELRERIKSALYMRWHLAGSDEAQLPDRDEGPEKWMEHIREAMDRLKDVLRGRRYLLVLDDVWDEKVEELHYLMTQALPPNATIVLTTRIPDVANAMATIGMAVTKPFLLQPLQPQLPELSQFLQDDSYSGDRSVDIVRDIAANCDGVPLLLRHAGSLLDQMKGEGSPGKPGILRSQEYLWQQVLDHHREVERDVLLCAYASYKYLPSDLKKCLLYCSVFPLDYSFDAQELADLLAAEGFIRPTMTEAERKGILQHLLDECFRPVKDSEHGWKIAYRMHKVLHIFAQRIHRQFTSVIRDDQDKFSEKRDGQDKFSEKRDGQDKFSEKRDGQDITTTDTPILYASLVVPPSTATFPKYLFKFRYLRTLVLLHEEKMWSADRRCGITNIPEEFCTSLGNLRTLSLQGCKITELPHSFDMLSYLRYLNLSRTDIKAIPSSISKLSFLQTLKLSHCKSLKKVDELNSKLVNLQVLDLEGCHQITEFPQYMSRIRGLVHLNLSHTCIGSIPRSISKLQFLQTLKLSHCRKLRKLHEKISKLVQLQELDLEGCYYLAGLPQDMNKIKSLSHLNVLECPCLTEMPRGMGKLTNLQTLLRYAVSNNGGSAISELGSLRNLQSLSLVIPENVESRDAELQNKQELESLAVQWNTDAERTSSTTTEVLQHLQPNQGLKILEIVAYEKGKFPSWMTKKDPYLKSLVEIRLVNIKTCETLPPLGFLPCLKIAEICGAEAIACIDDNFYGDKGSFPSLEKLTFAYMKSLKTWIQVRKNATFPRLAEVTIIQCPELALQVELPSVEKLNLWMNNKKLFSSGGGLGGVAQSLEHLSICFCEELGASAEGERYKGLEDLCNLEELEICGCDKMTCLPQSLQHLTSLRSLIIDSCCKLETLPAWLENLPLTLLCLSACPMLKSIPEGLRQHPDVKKIIEARLNLSAQSSGKSFVTAVSKSKETME